MIVHYNVGFLVIVSIPVHTTCIYHTHQNKIKISILAIIQSNEEYTSKWFDAFLNQSSFTFHCVRIILFNFHFFANELCDIVNGFFWERTKRNWFCELSLITWERKRNSPCEQSFVSKQLPLCYWFHLLLHLHRKSKCVSNHD